MRFIIESRLVRLELHMNRRFAVNLLLIEFDVVTIVCDVIVDNRDVYLPRS